jgi:phospho-N-acetylmuramoyl-pentapeptide-transferase
MIRLLLAAAISFTVSAVLTRVLIDVLTRSRIGQPIREDGPQGHLIKAGTPTMGGLAIVAGALGGYGLSDLISEVSPAFNSTITRSGLLVMAAIGSAGLVGFLDDWIKVSRERSLGLNAKLKTAGLLTVAILFAVLTVNLTRVHTELSFVRYQVPGIDFGPVGWVIWAVVLIYATSNAVNLTDGLDGLAAGSGIFSFADYTLLGFWMFRQAGERLNIYDVPHALDLAVVAVAMLAGCAGFLWFNAAPADIFMGDTGSLAIGTGLAALALVTNTHLLLPVIGAIYVIETTSVMLQVGFFKVTGGKRLFRMAPIHHHFELLGWKETKVIIRFWMIAGGLTMIGLGVFYADWIAASDVR